MTVEVHFEDGPMVGQTAAREDAPPQIYLRTPDAKKQFVAYGVKDPTKLPDSFEYIQVEYHRERAPHRTGCVCYWEDIAARDRAGIEDTYEVEDQLAC